MAKFCPECGSSITEADSEFCRKCGAKLPVISSGVQTPVTQPAQTQTTETTVKKKRSTLEWIAICCGGAIAIVIILVFLSAFIHGMNQGSSSNTFTPTPVSTPVSIQNPPQTVYVTVTVTPAITPGSQDPIVGSWLCYVPSKNVEFRSTFNPDGTYHESISMPGEVSTGNLMEGTWTAQGDYQYEQEVTGVPEDVYYWTYLSDYNQIYRNDYPQLRYHRV